MLEKQEKRKRRHRRIRAKIFGTAEKPRLCVFRSTKHIYVQLIDDQKSKVIAAASDLELKEKKEKKENKVERARSIGKLIARKAKDLKIEKVVFDRAGYSYHGRVKTIADSAREEGLKF